jgi:hypothetical protein
VRAMRRSSPVSRALAAAFLLGVAGLGVLAGCSSMTGGDDSATDCTMLTSGCPATPPSWQNDVQPIIATYCGSCHGSGGVERAMFDSTTYTSVFEARSTLATVIVNCSMPPPSPPAPSPDAAQRQTVLSWVECNAPDN